MKLLLCAECQDIVKLQKEERRCSCGKCSGKYLEDGLTAVFSGEHAVLIGLSNPSLRRAVLEHFLEPDHDPGILFDAFVIPDNASTVKKM